MIISGIKDILGLFEPSPLPPVYNSFSISASQLESGWQPTHTYIYNWGILGYIPDMTGLEYDFLLTY